MYGLIEWNEGTGVGSISFNSVTVRLIIDEIGIFYKQDSRNDITLNENIKSVEEAFVIQLKGRLETKKNEDKEGFLVAYIGKVDSQKNYKNYYDIHKNKFIGERDEKLCIMASTSDGYINSVEYIGCITDLICDAMQQGKKLKIFSNIESVEKAYRKTSLMEKTAKKLIKQVDGKIIYSNRQGSLYDDIFYEQIPDEEDIYVPVATTSTISPQEYEALGFEYITNIRVYSILRGKKKQFNQAIEQLYDNVLPQYRSQILFPAPLIKEPVNLNNNGGFEPSKEYKGKGVYIGVLGIDGIDYMGSMLRDQDGKTRLAYVWEQIAGGEGKDYTQDEIQTAINKNEKLSIYPSKGEYLSTTILGMAAGLITSPIRYEGLGIDSELVVAKIKKAPDTIQKIYVGDSTPEAVLLEDLLIGMTQLIEFANENRKPLVICLPYGSNISSHDGRKILESRIGNFAVQAGISIITMTGEEADKGHHGSVQINSASESRLDILVQRGGQKIVGTIWINPVYKLEVDLYSPLGDKIYDLTQRTIYGYEGERVISNGEWIRYDNGLRQIFFSMENLEKGKWQLVFRGKEEGQIYDDQVDVWITQEAINKYITLSPANVFTTITCLGNIENLICVGDYDQATYNVQKASGRGFTLNKIIKPTLIASGKRVAAMVGENEVAAVTGSIASMAKMAGVAAAIYSKFIQSNERWFPNSLVMGSIMVSYLTRIETITYPNPSQGNGIFNQQSLEKILDTDNISKL